MARYDRNDPSPEYRAMVAMYATMHEEGEAAHEKAAAETFSGKMLPQHAPAIRELILRSGARTILDYGSGKGQAYEQKDLELGPGLTVPSLKEYWGVDEVHCYDPGYEPYSELPTGRRFGGVICTDVLEHITEPDLPWILEEMFSFSEGFVYANVACYPAKKLLPNGQNAHCTIQSPEWWAGMIHAVAMRHTDVGYRFLMATKTGPRKRLGLVGKRTVEYQTVERWPS